MMDDQEVHEIGTLIVVCMLGAFVVSAILFVITLSGSRASIGSNSDTATSTDR
jgi:hypothetical protein